MTKEMTKDWAGFGSDYLKAIEVKSDEDEYAIVSVDYEEEQGKNTLILNVSRGEITKKFGCNKTNLQAVQAECPDSPEQAIGKVVTFNKVQVTNPQTKQLVDGLRIQFKDE